MEQVLALPAIGSYFRNQENTEIYKITLAGNHYIWVNGIDIAKHEYFKNRPYGTRHFLQTMIQPTNEESCAYNREIHLAIEELTDEILGF